MAGGARCAYARRRGPKFVQQGSLYVSPYDATPGGNPGFRPEVDRNARQRRSVMSVIWKVGASTPASGFLGTSRARMRFMVRQNRVRGSSPDGTGVYDEAED